MTSDKKRPDKKAPALPTTETPSHPDPARRFPDTTGHKNGYAPKPTLQ